MSRLTNLGLVFESNGTPPGDPAAPPAADPAPAAAQAPPKALTFDEWHKDPVNAEMVRKLREEAAGYRVKAKTAEEEKASVLMGIAKGLGLEIPGEAPDPAKLQTALEAARAETRELRIDSALSAASAKHNTDPRLTRALLMAEGALADLDPASAEFAAKIDAAVKKAVTDNPKLHVGQAPARGGGEFKGPGGPLAPAQLTSEEALDLRRRDPEALAQAFREGRANVLLGRS